jgi:hypothetical protein
MNDSGEQYHIEWNKSERQIPHYFTLEELHKPDLLGQNRKIAPESHVAEEEGEGGGFDQGYLIDGQQFWIWQVVTENRQMFTQDQSWGVVGEEKLEMVANRFIISLLGDGKALKLC